MDPNETLWRIREIARMYQTHGELPELIEAELIELIEALDGWLSRGGFLPAAWWEDRQTGRKE